MAGLGGGNVAPVEVLRETKLFKKPVDELTEQDFAHLRRFPFVLLQEKFLDHDFGVRTYPVSDLQRHPQNLRTTTEEGVMQMKYVQERVEASTADR